MDESLQISARNKNALAARLLAAANDFVEAVFAEADKLGVESQLSRETKSRLTRMMEDVNKILDEECLFEKTPLWLTHIKIGGLPPAELTE